MSNMLDDALAQMDAQLGIEPQADPGAEATQEAPDEGGTSDQQERQRDDQGRFIAGDKPDAAVEEGEEVAADPERPGWLPEQFASPEELARSWQEAQSMIGRQGQEYGEIRKELERLQSTISDTQPPAAYDEDNPAATAHLAFDSISRAVKAGREPNERDVMALRQAVEIWKDEDPFAAAVWVSTRQREQEIARLQSQYEDRLSAIQPLIFQSQAGQVVDQVRARFPDFDTYLTALSEVFANDPRLIEALGDPDRRDWAMTTAYKIAKADSVGNLSQAAQDAATQEAQESRAARQQAFVAAGSQRNEPESKSADELWLEQNFDPAAARYNRRD